MSSNYDFLELKHSNQSYKINLAQKAKTKKIIDKYGPSQKETWSKCNFKKNPGYKPIWSCGGYGGKCHNCKTDYYESRGINSLDTIIRNDLKEFQKISDN